MAKMKMRGAMPSHPIPPPPSCTASKDCIYEVSAFVFAKNRPRPLAPRELLFHHGVSIDFGRVPSLFRLESGEAVRRGQGFGRDQTVERKRDSSPSEIECRTRRIVSR